MLLLIFFTIYISLLIYYIYYSYCTIYSYYSTSRSFNLSNLLDHSNNVVNNTINSQSSQNKNILLDSDTDKYGVLSSDSSHDDENSSIDVPTRKKLPFQNSNNNEHIGRRKKLSSKRTSYKKSYNYLFNQPTEVDPLLTIQNMDSKENIYKRKVVDTSPKIKMSMTKYKSKVMRQTVLKFPKNTMDLENSILGNCETVSISNKLYFNLILFISEIRIFTYIVLF